MLTLLKHPSALLPIVMSMAALAVVVSHIAIFSAVREPDEGAAAHVWQILMGGQLPVILFFAAKWLPQTSRPAIAVLVLQSIAILTACAPVYYFNL